MNTEIDKAIQKATTKSKEKEQPKIRKSEICNVVIAAFGVLTFAFLNPITALGASIICSNLGMDISTLGGLYFICAGIYSVLLITTFAISSLNKL